MNKIITITILLLVYLSAFGQELKIINGTNSKLFKKGSLFEILTSECVKQKENKCCNCQELIGTITSVNKDSLTLKLSSFTHKREVENFNININDSFYSLTKTIDYKIGKDEIYYLKNYKSSKNKKRKENLTVVGGLLMATGIFTALNALIVSEKNNKNNILISGGTQFGLGLCFVIFGNSKKYNFKNSKKIWAIEQK